ncbi:MAG: Caspase domain protein [Firmicutes bacterium ADurb.Bin373]|nr:MAG: Caspase domain protein [Firmicutes bacterium ADurb.Bin373]
MRKHALLIGIDQYEDLGIQQLRGAENDAHEMAFMLERTCKFEQVEMLRGREACFSGVLDALERLARGLQRDDLFVFYFSGHGYDHAQQGHLLLLHDTVHRTLASMPNEVLPVRSLKEYTTGFDCRKIVFMLDACRSPLDKNRSVDAVSLGATAERDIKLLAARSDASLHDIQVLCSCSPGQQAFEIHPKRRGAFTLAFTGLVEQWAREGREVALTDTFLGNVEREMSRLLCDHGLGDKHQRPWKEGSASPAVLLPGNIRPSVAPPPPAPVPAGVAVKTTAAPLYPIGHTSAPVSGKLPQVAKAPRRPMMPWVVAFVMGLIALLAFLLTNPFEGSQYNRTEPGTNIVLDTETETRQAKALEEAKQRAETAREASRETDVKNYAAGEFKTADALMAQAADMRNPEKARDLYQQAAASYFSLLKVASERKKAADAEALHVFLQDAVKKAEAERAIVEKLNSGLWKGTWTKTGNRVSEFTFYISYKGDNMVRAVGTVKGWSAWEIYKGTLAGDTLQLTGIGVVQNTRPVSQYVLDQLFLSLSSNGKSLTGYWHDAEGSRGAVTLHYREPLTSNSPFLSELQVQ